jgi:hypothetical protein
MQFEGAKKVSAARRQSIAAVAVDRGSIEGVRCSGLASVVFGMCRRTKDVAVEVYK